MSNSIRISVLISGGGTTLRNLIEKRDAGSLNAEIVRVISNNPEAGGLKFASEAGIESVVVNHRQHPDVQQFSQLVFDECRSASSDLVVMGGFLRRVVIPQDYENRVINIHPSLIPAFSGKGHYGRRVHEAVLKYGCKLSGCTVHFVDDDYDHGPIIAQQTVEVHDSDTPEILAKRVFQKECELLPQVINWIAMGAVSIHGRSVTIERG